MEVQPLFEHQPMRHSNHSGSSGFFRMLCYWIAITLSLVAQASHAEDATTPDVRVLIDVSGSMKQNDPHNLRVPAIELLCRLMPQGSRAGMWFFAQGVAPVVKLSPVDAEWKKNAIRLSKTINSQGLLTDIGAVLEKAAQEPSPPGFKKHIILLTDGVVDVGPDAEKNQAQWKRISNELLPKLKADGFHIHTIALSEKADRNLLEKLSVGTDAASVVALSADQLVKAFLQVFDTAAPQPQLPIEGNNFDVDKSIEEITALIFRGDVAGQITLTDPQGHEFNAQSAPKNVNWFRSDSYDLITLNKPAIGKWTLGGSLASGSRLTLVSDLKLAVQPLPNNIFVGEGQDLSLQLQEAGKTYINPELLKLMHFSAELVPTDGKTEEPLWARDLTATQPPADGVFHGLIPAQTKEGVASLSVIADGKTFKREYRQRISMRQRFSAEIEPVSDNGYELVIKTYDESIDKNSVNFLAQLEDSQHEKQPLTLTMTPVDTWVGALDIAQPGSYLVKIAIKASDKNGVAVLHEIAPIPIAHKLDQAVKETPPAVPVQEPVEVEPKAQEPVAPQAPADVMPNWLFYSLLAAANVSLIGLIYFLYKKFVASKSEEEVLSAFALEPTPEPVREKPKKAPAPPPPMEEYDETQMQIPATEDEIPPMEDLDPDSDMSAEPDDNSSSPTSDMDIDALFAEQATEAPPKKDEADDMVQAMLRAQGLDLAEDEMDDAISNLIDELDDTEAKANASSTPDDASEDFDNFDDFGMDDDDKR
ncbi:MAG TPA: vWA domain-containing protein [Cellvibrionaceae bacterium]